MKLYNSIGPNPRMVRMFMAEKGFDVPRVDVDLLRGENRREPYLMANPSGQCPALELDDGTVLAEITAICEYVDETFDGTRLYPTDPRDRARARQIQAWVRSDLMPIRDERPTFVVFNGAKRPALSEAARDAAERLFSAALTLLDGRTNNLFGAWSIADVDLAMMLQRLVVLGDPVPQRLIDYATHQWRRPSVEQWILKKRPPLIGY